MKNSNNIRTRASTRHHREQSQSVWKLDYGGTIVASPEWSVSATRTRPSFARGFLSCATSILQIVHFNLTLDVAL